MSDLNLVVLEGRLTREPKLDTTTGGKCKATFRIAVHRNGSAPQAPVDGDGDGAAIVKKDADFIEVVTWEKQAASCGEFLKKGRSVIVEGRLTHDEWKDDEGNPHSKLYVTASRVRFRGGRGKEEQAGAPTPEAATAK